jgi:hypothetical protein
MLYVVFLACILLQVESYFVGSGIEANAGYDKTLILVLLLGSTGLVLSFGVHFVYKDIQQSLKQSTVIHGEKGATIEFKMLTADAFHLFLSHTWATGQNQMQALKKELTLLVPSLKIFLDVEDLTNLGDLEALIENSEVVLIFLSSGYFSRWNCLREVRQALVAKKDVILLREMAEMHGGGSMTRVAEELERDGNKGLNDSFDAKYESPGIADIRKALTDWSEGSIILWHRGECASFSSSAVQPRASPYSLLVNGHSHCHM